MNETRSYIPGLGFEISGANFSHHKLECLMCQRFDEKNPATLALLCLDGSVLWKKGQPVTKREEKPYDPNHVSLAEAKAAMRYK